MSKREILTLNSKKTDLNQCTTEAKSDGQRITDTAALINAMIRFDIATEFVVTDAVQWGKHEEAAPF